MIDLFREGGYKLSMQALVCTLGVFAMIVVLARLKAPLVVAIIAGTVAIGLLFGQSLTQVVEAMGAGVLRPKTLSLVIVTALLLSLSAIMQAAGRFKEIVTLASSLLRRPGVTMASLPALVGLLPMPGGALFSAPMVEAAAGDNKVEPALLSAINYWFRHIWETWWPLYPGVVLALSFNEGDYLSFAAFQLPLGVGMAAAGLLLFRGTHPDLHAKADPPPPGVKRKLIKATAPIWLIVLVWAPAKFALTHWVMPAVSGGVLYVMVGAERYLPLAGGLIVSLVWTAASSRLPTGALAKAFAKPMIWLMPLLVGAIMVFKHVLDELGAAGQMADELVALNVPIVLVVAALPFIAGMVTGLAVGFVGMSFPIVAGLVAALGDGTPARPYMVLAYAFGHLGQMMSPLHFCQVVSNRYFNVTARPLYRRILPAAAATAAFAIAYFALLRALM